MDLKLKVLEGKSAGQEIPVRGAKFFIGRAEDCQLRPGSELISRHHCVILVDESYVGVRDFGSKNGTFVNDERVAGERELKGGDRLTVGPLRFEICVNHGLAAKKRPPVADIKEAAVRAAQAAAQDPMDVAQWLVNEPENATTELPTPPRAAKPAAAQPPAAQPPAVPPPAVPPPAAQSSIAAPTTDTQSISMSTTQTMTPARPHEEEQPKAPLGKKSTGKLPPAKNTKDSQEAAAAMLDRLRRRR